RLILVVVLFQPLELPAEFDVVLAFRPPRIGGAAILRVAIRPGLAAASQRPRGCGDCRDGGRERVWRLATVLDAKRIAPAGAGLRRSQHIGAGDAEDAVYYEGRRNHMGHRNRVAVNRVVPDAASLDGIGAGKHLGGIGAGSDPGEQPVAEFVTGPEAE